MLALVLGGCAASPAEEPPASLASAAADASATSAPSASPEASAKPTQPPTAPPTEPPSDDIWVLSIVPGDGELIPETENTFDIRVGYRLASAATAEVVVLFEMTDGTLMADPFASTWQVSRGEGEVELQVQHWVPPSHPASVVLTVNIFDMRDGGTPHRLANAQGREYPIAAVARPAPGPTRAAAPTPSATRAAAVSTPAPTRAPAGPTIQARPAVAKPGDRVDFVVSGFPIPVRVLHVERVLPDGRRLPLRHKHDWGGPYATWWIDDLNYLGAGPWPSGVYIERFEVEGVRYDVPVTVQSSTEGTPLGPRRVSARAERIGTADRVILLFSGFPLFTEISLKEIAPPAGLTTPYDWSEVTTAFEYTWPSYLVFHVDEPRGTYTFLFEVEGVEYKVAVELSP